jgi:hypothetical protein
MTGTLKRALLLGVMTLALAACQEDPPATVAPGTFDPNLATRLKAECEADGGRWGVGGSGGGFVCYRTTRDANQSCSADGDCEGLCLARSRTCAPVTPFFGCNEVLNSQGVPQMLCID